MSDKKRIKLEIEVDNENNIVIVKTSEGEEFILQSLALFGGDAIKKNCFIQMYGSSADAAWAYGRGFVIAQSPEGGRALRNFYKQSAAHVCHAIDPEMFRQTVEGEEMANKWESEDQTKWHLWDSEDVLVDKEKSEKRAKALLEMIESKKDQKDWH